MSCNLAVPREVHFISFEGLRNLEGASRFPLSQVCKAFWLVDTSVAHVSCS